MAKSTAAEARASRLLSGRPALLALARRFRAAFSGPPHILAQISAQVFPRSADKAFDCLSLQKEAEGGLGLVCWQAWLVCWLGAACLTRNGLRAIAAAPMLKGMPLQEFWAAVLFDRLLWDFCKLKGG